MGDILETHMNERTWLNRVTETQKKRKIEESKVEGNRGVWNHSSSHGQSEYTTPQIMVSESFHTGLLAFQAVRKSKASRMLL